MATKIQNKFFITKTPTIPGGGEMGELIRNYDWSNSLLGSSKSWPQSLKTALSICLGSKFPMPIWWGKDLTVFYNDAYIPFAGLKHPTYLGKPAREQWAEIWNDLKPLTEQVLQTGESTWAESMLLYITRKGFLEETYFTFSFSPIRDENGEITGIINPCQEMTDVVLAERRLKVLRELGPHEIRTTTELGQFTMNALKTNPQDIPFALLYLNSTDQQTATLLDNFAIDPNSAFAKQTSILVGPAKKIDDLRSLYLNDLPQTPFPERPESAYILPLEIQGQEKPAGYLVLGISPRLIFDQKYQDFFGLIAQHITSHLININNLEKEKKQNEILAEVDRVKTTFFSNVSHEFRTPLTLLLGPLEDILNRKKSELLDQTRTEIEIVHRNALRLLKLVNTLLDFSRIEANRAQTLYESTDLVAMTGYLANAFQSVIAKAQIKLTLNLEPLPEPAFVDREMWEKIVLNLISNAFKYTHSGEISISLKARGDKILFSVQDTGIGIPEEELPKIFQRFHRVKGARGRTHEGTGIGLALVKELVKLHYGSIHVESELGKGSTFTVEISSGKNHLPAHHVSKKESETFSTKLTTPSYEAYVEEAIQWVLDLNTEKENHVSSPDNQINDNLKKRIVLADDNLDMRTYISKLLSKSYTVFAESDGKKAFEMIKTHLPDLVISDVMMPVMDGTQLLNKMRLDPLLQTIPVILLSARAGEEAKISGLEMGADDYLVKPFSAKELFARVQTQLQMNEIRKKAIEQEAIAKQLSTQHQWLESVLDLIPTPLLLLEIETGFVKFANQATHKMAGAEISLNTPLTISKDLTLNSSVLKQKIKDKELVWKTSMGEFSLLVDSEMIPSNKNQPDHVILCLRDVTHMKEIQTELKRHIGTRDEFLSVASHELKTPLTTISLQTELIKRNLSKGNLQALSPNNIIKLVERTDRQVERLTHLVDDMLDVSRIETGRLSLHTEIFDLAKLTQDALERLSEIVAQSGSKVILHAEKPVIGKWDRFRIEQVISNLVTNAYRYGNGKPIEVSVDLDQQAAHFKITDHGKGIDKNDQARIFKRFERAVPFSEVSGLGLGLYIAQQIIELHGGSIQVESALGHGSSFNFRLPLKNLQEEQKDLPNEKSK